MQPYPDFRTIRPPQELLPEGLRAGLVADGTDHVGLRPLCRRLIPVFLGPKWKGAAVVFRLLAPTTLAFAILNPMGWLLNSLGLVGRGLKIALVLGPVMIAGYVVGLPYGPKGVALAYSSVMMLSVIPLIAWVTHGTVISLSDILLTISRPFFSGLVAAGLGFGLQFVYGPMLPPLPRLVVGVAVVFSALPRNAPVRHGTETVLHGSAPGIHRTHTSRRRTTSLCLINHDSVADIEAITMSR